MNKIRLTIYQIAFVFLWPLLSWSAEFDGSEVLPTISYISFNKDGVGFASDKNERRFFSQLFNSGVYFIYDRHSRKIIEVDEKHFLTRFPKSKKINQPNYNVGKTTSGVPYKSKSIYCEDGATKDSRELIVNNKVIDLKALQKCSNVFNVEIVNGNQLWIATFTQGGHGIYGAEGIIVQNLNDAKVLARIISIQEVVERMYVDPISNNVWAITARGIYEISPQFEIVSVNLYYYNFEPGTGQPRYYFANKVIHGDPFSVVSRLLPLDDRKRFYEVVSKIPKEDAKQFELYYFFMCCNFNAPKYPVSMQPLTPIFIKALKQNDDYHDLWRQSICRLGGPDSIQYCNRAN